MKAFPNLDYHLLNQGMDLRDYFAAKAMVGASWFATTESNTYERDAKECYKIADAMMKARTNETN